MDNDMKLYWVSYIDNDCGKPALVAISSGCTDLEEAKDCIKTIRYNHTVLSAWIDVFDENNNKTTVFHECYINALGCIDVPN